MTGQSLISDYSPIASQYDATRDLPEAKLLACYARLVAQNLFPPAGRILDAGCGTGQVSLALAARGYEVHGIDVSKAMTVLAQSKVRPDWRAHYVVDDVRSITAADNSFDAAVVSKLFQHVQDWRQACQELIRVVRPGGTIVQINERGAFSNSVRRVFSRKADELCFDKRYAGLNPHGGEDLTTFMVSQGCQPVPVDMSDLRWDVTISYRAALDRIQQRLFAEFWRLPANIYDRLIADTRTWIEAQPDGAGTVDHLKPYFVIEVFITPS